MHILGIDPGINRTGWGIIEDAVPSMKVVNYDCLVTPASWLIEERLKKIYSSLLEIVGEYTPDCMVVEELFFNTNAKTALIVGQARGVILLAAATVKLPVFVYTPLQVKIAVAGYGRAEKKQVGEMVKILLKLKEVPKPDDTADALAIALTHAFSRKLALQKSKLSQKRDM